MAEPIITIAAWRGIEDHLRLFNDDRGEFLRLLGQGGIPYEDIVLVRLGFGRLRQAARAMERHNVSLLTLDEESRQQTAKSLQDSGLGFTLFSPRLRTGRNLDPLFQNHVYSPDGPTWWVSLLVDLAQSFPDAELEVTTRPGQSATNQAQLSELVAEFLCYVVFSTTDDKLFSKIASTCMERYEQISQVAQRVLGDATANWNLEYGAASDLREEITKRGLEVGESPWLSGVKDKVYRVRSHRSIHDTSGETAVPNLGARTGWVRHR